MSKGYVYILSNPAMPGYFKVGKTTRSVAERANELFTTGLPEPFKVEYDVLSPDCDQLESRMHQALSKSRATAAREFFQGIELSELIHLLIGMHIEQVKQVVDEFLPDYEVCNPDLIVSEADVCKLASEANAHPFEVAHIMARVSWPELAGAKKRHEAAVAERRANMKVVPNG